MTINNPRTKDSLVVAAAMDKITAAKAARKPTERMRSFLLRNGFSVENVDALSFAAAAALVRTTIEQREPREEFVVLQEREPSPKACEFAQKIGIPAETILGMDAAQLAEAIDERLVVLEKRKSEIRSQACSDRQCAAIAKLGSLDEDNVRAMNLTKGQASDLIARLTKDLAATKPARR